MEYIGVTFEYLDGTTDDLSLSLEEYDKLMAHVRKQGFVGLLEESDSGYNYNLALVKCFY